MAASSDDLSDYWGKLPADIFSLIARRLDVTSTVRLAACSQRLYGHVAYSMSLNHWDGPCLLMPDSARWHYDDSSAHDTVYDAVPLDHPPRTAILPFMDNRFWVGMNGDWIAVVDLRGTWFLANVYTHQEIRLPSSVTCNIWREELLGVVTMPPERYLRHHSNMYLMKLVICEVPTKAGHYADYKLIALFQSGLAYLEGGSQEWRFLECHDQFSGLVHYNDAIQHGGIIFAVDAWTGSTHSWNPAQDGNFSINI